MIVVCISYKENILLVTLTASVMCLHFRMQADDIVEHIDALECEVSRGDTNGEVIGNYYNLGYASK